MEETANSGDPDQTAPLQEEPDLCLHRLLLRFAQTYWGLLRYDLRRGVYICSCVYEILAHAELFGLFHLFTLFLGEFDYTGRV